MKNIPLCWILLLCIISFEQGFCAIPDAGHIQLTILDENSSSDIHFSRESIVYCNENEPIQFRIIHLLDYDLSCDPDPATTAGIRYLLFTQPPPPINIHNLQAVKNISLLTQNGKIVYMGSGVADNIIFDEQLMNNIGLKRPFELWIVPFIAHNTEAATFDDLFESDYACLDFKTSAAVSVKALNKIKMFFKPNLKPDGIELYYNEVWGTGGYPELHTLLPYQLHIINNSTLDSLEVIRPGNDKNRFKTDAVEGNYFFTLTDPIGCSSGGYDNFDLVQPEVKVYSRFDYAYRGEIRCMPVYVDNFFDLNQFIIGMDWDESQLRLADVNDIHPLLTQGQFAIDTTQAKSGRMKMTWADSMDFKLPPGTKLFDLCFRVLANQGTRANISFNEFSTYFNNGNFEMEWIGEEGTILVLAPSSPIMRKYSYCYTDDDRVQITFHILGEDPPFVFEIPEAGIIKTDITETQFTITDVPAGTYSYRVTDLSNNTEYSRNAIEIPPGGTVNLSVEEIVFPECDAEKGIIKLNKIDQDIQFIHILGPGLDQYFQQKTLFENLDAGNYTFIAGEVNGCTSDTLNVELEGKSSLDISVDQTASSCDSGSSKAKIIVLNVDQDTVMTNFTLDYSQVFAANTSIDITPGLHTVEVMNPKYCSITKEITVKKAEPSMVSIAKQDENQNIKKGKPFTVLANYTTATGLDTWLWSPSGLIQSSSINEATFTVDSSLWIQLQVTDNSGCTIKDSIFISIKEEGQPSEDISYYVPNAFTPNGDDINDRLEFFTKDTSLSVQEVRIFDRYGNKLFSSNGPFLNNELWDGKSQQSLVPPGVYVLTISIRKGDDSIKQLTKDITVIR